MAVLAPGPSQARRSDDLAADRHRRKLRQRIHDAFRGLKLGIRGHSSFFVHFFFLALALAAGIVLRCDIVEWCLLFLSMVLVLTCQLFNSAVEVIYRGLDVPTQARARSCLDMAAGAVLLASLTAGVVGACVFLNRLLALLD